MFIKLFRKGNVMAKVEFRCSHCGLHYSLMCECPDTVIEYVKDNGCPDCGRDIRPLKCDGRWILTMNDINALVTAGLIRMEPL